MSLGPYNKMVVYIYDGTQIMSVVKTIVKIGNLIWWRTVPQKLNKHWSQSGLKSGGAHTYKSSGGTSSLVPLLISIELGSVFPCIDLFWFFSMPVKKHQNAIFVNLFGQKNPNNPKYQIYQNLQSACTYYVSFLFFFI